MYTSFRIENFRCFRDLEINNLARVNLLAGRNNVGKSAFLEALWLHAGPDLPDLGVRLNTFRGRVGSATEGAFNQMFKNFDSTATILMSAKGDWGSGTRDLHIQVNDRSPAIAPLDVEDRQPIRELGGPTLISESQEEVVLTYTDEDGKKYTNKGHVIQSELRPGVLAGQIVRDVRQLVSGRPDPVYFAARHRTSAAEDAERFGKIQVERKEDEVVRALQHAEPLLQRIITISEEGQSVFYADLGEATLMPVHLMGDGIARLLSLTLSFVTARKIFVLFDEVENGLHYSIMTDVWKALAHLGREFDVQIFATTHSHECIRSAHQAFQGDADGAFRLHRLDRIGDDINVVTYEPEMLDTALGSGLEIR